MPPTFFFGCQQLKRKSCEIPFPKSVVYSDVLLEKLVQSANFLSQQKPRELKFENC